MVYTWKKKEKTKELDPRMIYTIKKKTSQDRLIYLIIDGLIRPQQK